MRGLSTQESEAFNRYWDLIQRAAAKENCIFFGYAGEGRDFFDGDIEGEDFGGWLVPKDNADEFEKKWKEDKEAMFENTFGAKFSFAIWKKDGKNIDIFFDDFSI